MPNCPDPHRHKRHLERGEVCDPCRLAFNAHMREYKRKWRADKAEREAEFDRELDRMVGEE